MNRVPTSCEKKNGQTVLKCVNKSISTNVRFSANFNQAQEIIYKTTIRQITDCKKKKSKDTVCTE